jgi:hypothetical protein
MGCLLALSPLLESPDHAIVMAWQEYPHVASATQDSNGARASGGAQAVEGWDLPPARELFWGRQKLQRDGQTVFGDVWAGVRRPAAAHLMLARHLLRRC